MVRLVLTLAVASLLGLQPDAALADSGATVLEHRLSVSVVSSKRMDQTHTWRVRIDDPETAGGSVPAPPGLEGASNAGAVVVDERLVLPAQVEAGAEFTLRTRTTDWGGPWSGSWITAPDVPVVVADVEIRAPSWVPLTVWSDSRTHSEYSSRGGRHAHLSWEGLDGGEPAQVVWSTWKDWLQAGDRVTAGVEELLAPPERLGRELASDLSGATLAMATERVNGWIALEPGPSDWTTSSAAAKIAARRRGTPADRGVVLLSLLRAAGHIAEPAYFRPHERPGAVPVGVPAPALLDHPVIAVQTRDGTVWIDPASDHVAIPQIPASMRGATAWVPGDLPIQVASTGVVDGVVSVSGQITLGHDGSNTWSTTVTASGVAEEWLRRWLHPLGDDARLAELRALVASGHPDLERFGGMVTGIDDPYRSLRITLQGYEPAALEPLGSGLTGTLPPILAAPLAGVLPAGLLIREEISVTPPSGMVPLSAAESEPVFHPEVTLTRSLVQKGRRWVLLTEVERHRSRGTTRTRDEAARGFLDDEAATGPQLLVYVPATPPVIKELRRIDSEREPAEIAVVEALLWWSIDNEKKARKAISKALDAVGEEAVVVQLRRHGRPGDVRPWTALSEVVDTDALRLVAVLGLESAGAAQDGWVHAARLTASDDPQVRLQALLAQERMQSERPSYADDPLGHSVWRDSEDLLATAEEEAIALDEEALLASILVRRAELKIAQGQTTEAEVLLERAMELEEDPVAMVLLAVAAARSGVAEEDVIARIDGAVSSSPFDSHVVAAAASAVAEVGRHDKALDYGLSAARLAFDDPEAWLRVVDYALRAGDLSSAAFAARRASDLQPDSVEAGQTLQLMGTLSRDHEAAILGATRAGERPKVSDWPPGIFTLVATAPPEALLAVLQFHDTDVVASSQLLELRAQLRLESGLYDGAARDGIILAARHDDPAGTALAFTATAGRLWSTTAREQLDRAATRDPLARSTRMEYRLVTGSGDPLSDARAIKDDPRAAIILRSASDPNDTAAEVAGWPEDVPEPSVSTPRGFRRNRLLGAPRGVAAWSDATHEMAVLRVGRITGTIPAPLGLLFTPGDAPVRSLPGGGQVTRLDGGALPLYAASAFDGAEEVIGLGYTVDAAVRALDRALP